MKRNNSAVWLENQNRWQVNVQRDGVRKTFTSAIPGRAGKADANRKADEWLDMQTVDGTASAVSIWAKWVESLVSKDAITKANTFFKLYVSPVFLKKPICKITEGDLQSVLDRAVKNGLAWKSVANVRGSLAAFAKWVRMNHYANISTQDLSISKTVRKGKKEILQPDDIRKLWQEGDSLYINLFRLAVLTGLRPGELIGLKWSDVTDSRLHIQRSISIKGVETNGKNENAIRTIWLGKYELDVLEAQRKLLRKRGLISPWMFPRKDSNHTSQSTVLKSWQLYCKKAGITTKVTPYGWRHTFVSINNDMPSGLKRRRVGHAVSMDTEGIYGQAVAGEDEQAAQYVAQRFDAIFNDPQKHT